MAALDFPASSSSPWTAPNGVIYTWNTDGYWEAKGDPLKGGDTTYLRLDTTNDPVTGNLELSANFTLDSLKSKTLLGTDASGQVIDSTGSFNTDLDDRFLSAKVADTADGLIVFSQGVRVTGGTPSTVSDGIIKTGGGSIALRGSGRYVVVSDGTGLIGLGGTIPSAGQLVRLNSDLPSGDSYGYYNACTIKEGVTNTSYVRSYLTENISTVTSVSSVKLFDAATPTAGGISADLTINEIFGYYSEINNLSRFSKAYNFYAAGSAPNYFAGSNYIGGTPSSPEISLLSGGDIKAGTLDVNRTIGNVYTGIGVFSSQTDRLMLRSGGTNVIGLDANGTTTIGFDGTLAGYNPLNIRFRGDGANNGVEEDDSGYISWSARNTNGISVSTAIFGPVIEQDAGSTNNISAKFSFQLNSGGGVTEKASIDSSGLGDFRGGLKLSGNPPLGTLQAIGGSGGGLNFYGATSFNPGDVQYKSGSALLLQGDLASGGSQIVYACRNLLTLDAAIDTYRGFEMAPDFADGATYTGVQHYRANPTRNAKARVNYQAGFVAHSNLADVGTSATTGVLSAVGFSSNLGVGDDDHEYFNFYAEGIAPNYFAGSIYIGAATQDPAKMPPGATSGAGIFGNLNIASQTSPTNAGILFTSGSSGTWVNNHVLSVYNGATIGGSIRIQTGGDLAFVNPSDHRLKTNIQTVSANASETIKALNVVSYTDRDNNNIPYGFIAHELQEHVPEAVFGTKDETQAIGTLTEHDGTIFNTLFSEAEAEDKGLEYTEEVEATPYREAVAATYDEDGNEVTAEVPGVEATYRTVTRTRTWTATDTRPVYQGVDQSKLIPLLTKALQEALERIEALEAAAK